MTTPLKERENDRSAGMTGVLALVGGGEWTEGCTFDAGLLAAADTDEVVVMPTGSAYEGPALLVEQARAWFAALGAKVVESKILMRADAMLDDNAALLAEAKFIYLAGASAMHLRSVLKDSPALDAMVAAWRAGAVLAGTNAGADVICDPMVDSRGGAYTVGLGVVSDLAVIPRSDTWSRDKIHRTVQLAASGVTLAEVPERTALIRATDGTWRSEGVGTVQIYVDGKPAGIADLRA